MHSTTHEALTKYNKYRNLISTDPQNSNVYRHKIQKYTTALQRGGFSVAGFKNSAVPDISADDDEDEYQKGGVNLRDMPGDEIEKSLKDSKTRKPLVDELMNELDKELIDKKELNTAISTLDLNVNAMIKRFKDARKGDTEDHRGCVNELNAITHDLYRITNGVNGVLNNTIMTSIQERIQILIDTISTLRKEAGEAEAGEADEA